MNEMPILSHGRLLEVLSYNRTTGQFTWRSAAGHFMSGKIAGATDRGGYRLIRVDGILYRACRLAWFYETGEWPTDQIDHKNMVRGDDRWENLREASNSQNNMNRKARRNTASGLKGVSWCKTRLRWKAMISVNGKRHHLGSFSDPVRAHEVYALAAESLHGQFSRAQ